MTHHDAKYYNSSFQEFGNNEASDDELDLNKDYLRKTVRVNIHGKKIRGADLELRLKYKFLSTSEYFVSQLYIEIKEMFARKRKNDDLCHGDVHHHVQQEIRLVVIFTPLQTLNYLWKTNNLYSDTTNYGNFP